MHLRSQDIEGWEAPGGGIAVLEPPPRRRRKRSNGPPGTPPGPPGDGDGGGGGGGGGDGEDGSEPAGEGEGDGLPISRAELAFGFLLTGIGTLFLTFLGAWLVLRRTNDPWPPLDAPGPPRGLWASTAALALTSLALSRATAERRAGRPAVLRRWLAGATVAGLGFLLCQALLWQRLDRQGLSIDSNAYGTVFYSLTGLHALHVVGGLAYLLRILMRCRGDAPLAGRRTPVEFCAVYWHFLGAIWVAVFAVVYFVD